MKYMINLAFDPTAWIAAKIRLTEPLFRVLSRGAGVKREARMGTPG